MRRVAVLSVVLGLTLLANGCGDDDPAIGTRPLRGAGVSQATTSGPVSGGTGKPFIAATTFDPAIVGYAQSEYFLSGTATAYTSINTMQKDGHWDIQPGATAPFKTRLVVFRPVDPKKFNGTVYVEWLNVSGGLDAAADWLMGHVQMIREGAAWVGVSAQYVGVEGGDSLLGISIQPLKTVDPERYASLSHPGDSFSYDIFSQAGQSIRRPQGVNPLDGLSVERLLAIGESQSAFRFVTYINAVHPVASMYDGFLVHSRGGGGVSAIALSESPQPAIPVAAGARIRDDLADPVLDLQTETDLTILESVAARQPDSDRFRLWEIAGTSHADTYTVLTGSTDTGNSPDAAKLVLTSEPVTGFTCSAPINSGPHHFIVNTALSALNRWVEDGTPPPVADRIELNPNPPTAIARDANGNARGGIRTPQIDVPIATFVGEGRGSIVCLLFGRTMAFAPNKLATLYPTHASYVNAIAEASDRAVRAGFLLSADAELIKAAASSSTIGG